MPTLQRLKFDTTSYAALVPTAGYKIYIVGLLVHNNGADYGDLKGIRVVWMNPEVEMYGSATSAAKLSYCAGWVLPMSVDYPYFESQTEGTVMFVYPIGSIRMSGVLYYYEELKAGLNLRTLMGVGI